MADFSNSIIILLLLGATLDRSSANPNLTPREIPNQLASYNSTNENMSSQPRKINSRILGVGVLEVPRDQWSLDMATFDDLIKLNPLHNKFSVAQMSFAFLKFKQYSMIFSDSYIHRYNSLDDLKSAAGPQTNHELCVRGLEQLLERSRKLRRERYQSRDIQIYKWLENFGRLPSAMTDGSSFWMGNYKGCLTNQIEFPASAGGLQNGGKFCVASLRHQDWLSGRPDGKLDALAELTTLKIGTCLPKACDSTRFRNKFELVAGLLEAELRPMEQSQLTLEDLYCLPDEDSPLRSITSSPWSLASFCLICLWTTIVTIATIRYEQLSKRRQIGSKQLESQSSNVGITSGFKTESTGWRWEDLYKNLAITNNARLLFSTTKKSSMLQADTNGNTVHSSEEQLSKRTFVNLDCLEGVKVISMCYVITGHVLMSYTVMLREGRDTVQSTSPPYLLAHLLPGFAVNSFFTITGLLTCYLMFKQRQASELVKSPTKWFLFSLYRYLRIMPMYALVVLYAKHLARYTGQGPLWDYGTSEMGQRHHCEQESWLWTFGFAANFKPPLDHCIPSAWYLANDFQYFIITPLILSLLQWRPKLGKRLLVAGIALSFILNHMSILTADLDLGPIARFEPHGFKIYASRMAHNYTRPQYRILSYLAGLLFGFMLYEYELRVQSKASIKSDSRDGDRIRESSIERDENNNLPPQEDLAKTGTEKSREQDQECWPSWFYYYGISGTLLALFVCCGTGLFASRVTFEPVITRIIISLMIPVYHLLFSTGVGAYVLLASTGHGHKLTNRFLSSPLWKPLSRMSLSVVLVNVEVCCYVTQTMVQLLRLDFVMHTSLNLFCIVASYMVATVLCILFEAPLRASLNQILAALMSRMTTRQKQIKTD